MNYTSSKIYLLKIRRSIYWWNAMDLPIGGMLWTCQKNAMELGWNAMELNNFFNMGYFTTRHLETNFQGGELSLLKFEPHLIYLNLSSTHQTSNQRSLLQQPH